MMDDEGKQNVRDFGLMFDDNGMAELKKKHDENMAKQRKTLQPLIEKSFDYHDTLKNKVLEPDESKLFFEHYVAEQGEFFVALQASMHKKIIEINMQMMAGLMGGQVDKKQMQKNVQAQVDAHVAKIKKLVDEQIASYTADKASRNAAAFKVLDVNGDGKLQKDEVVEALIPDTDKNKQFVSALGINPEELLKKQIQAQMEQAMAGLDDACTQQ